MISRRPVVIANEIRLKRSQHKGAFFVVEGRDDRLFCERFIHASTCKIVVAEGKESVCEVIKILDEDRFPGVVGLVDADFDRVEGCEVPSINVILSDTHDLETMLIRSPALERVLIEFGSTEKLATFGRDVRAALLDAALPVGCLRLYSRQNSLNLRFQGLDYTACVSLQSLDMNRQSLAQEVQHRSQRPDLSPAALEVAIRAMESARNDPWQICSGDDLIAILAIGLRRAWGTHSATTVKPEELRRSLRLAYAENEFVDSHLAEALRAWEIQHPPFRILR